jgi:hypothetical protein
MLHSTIAEPACGPMRPSCCCLPGPRAVHYGLLPAPEMPSSGKAALGSSKAGQVREGTGPGQAGARMWAEPASAQCFGEPSIAHPSGERTSLVPQTWALVSAVCTIVSKDVPCIIEHIVSEKDLMLWLSFMNPEFTVCCLVSFVVCVSALLCDYSAFCGSFASR